MLSQLTCGQGRSNAMLVSDRTMPRRSPPTYIRQNEFTAVAQQVVDTYGLPRYREANPALFTIVTFPFLFGVMYGDIGHGSMVLAIGAFAIWKADRLKTSIPQLYAFRYMLFMMGAFGVYAGFLYNDFFSLGLNLFESQWQPPTGEDKEKGESEWIAKYDTTNKGLPGGGPYPFGIDPAWHGAHNELIFMNSMKMKISVIIGVAQMIVGLLIRFSNVIHDHNFVDLVCECVPMMVFMLCFFGFMDYMILYKWVTPMQKPPSIINALIKMWIPGPSDEEPMFGESVPELLKWICLLTIPWLLIPKVVILYLRHQEEQRRYGQVRRDSGTGRHIALGEEEESLHAEECDAEEPFDITEVAIHQVIETIEYVLGSVSHTASYLRLWALSLAHQQLSAVFFKMTILLAMGAPFPLNMITLYFAFAVWMGITLGILVGMDVMECFLHTLRLHWVEFQSKFFKGDGYPFVPFSHRDVLMHRGDE